MISAGFSCSISLCFYASESNYTLEPNCGNCNHSQSIKFRCPTKGQKTVLPNRTRSGHHCFCLVLPALISAGCCTTSCRSVKLWESFDAS
ncbi:hypothetical protein SRHO_G00045030 [Serrasalmus rhombeus]